MRSSVPRTKRYSWPPSVVAAGALGVGPPPGTSDQPGPGAGAGGGVGVGVGVGDGVGVGVDDVTWNAIPVSRPATRTYLTQLPTSDPCQALPRPLQFPDASRTTPLAA